MSTKKIISFVFVVAALYDGLLGAIFLVTGNSVFQWYGVTPPNHPGYIVFPAALLIIFALMFAAVARNPIANRNLIPYGILLKVSYCGAVLFYWLTEGLPDMWKPFCIVDFAFMFVFIWAWTALGKEKVHNAG
jgi:hypothetical protein